MLHLKNSINSFVQSVRQGEFVSLKAGKWKIEGELKKKYLQITGKEGEFFCHLFKEFISVLESLEKIPISFSKVPYETSLQTVDFKGYLSAAYALLERGNTHLKKTNQDILFLLERHIVGLSYRLERENGGVNPSMELNLQTLIELEEKALSWKIKQKIFWEKSLSEKDNDLLIQASLYPNFISLLLKDQKLQKHFFCWIIRDGNPVQPFIEFPFTTRRLIDSRLSGRVGRMRGKTLKIQLDPLGKKHLTLMFEGAYLSILDDKKVITLKGGYTLTLSEIFDIFRFKNLRVGNVEFLENGVVNWNCHWCGWWDPKLGRYQLVDVKQPEWWWALPSFERLTKDQAKERYGDRADGKTWVLVAKASRKETTLNYENTHAYLELAIPHKEEGYKIFEFGKFAREYPANTWDLFRMFAIVVQGTIAYPDENVYLSHRQHIGYSFALTPELGEQCMHLIQRDILRARAGSIVFQSVSDNCGKWIDELLGDLLGRDKIPNLYLMPLIDSEPEGFVKKLFSLIRLLPVFLRTRAVAWVHYPFFPWKGKWIIDKSGKKVWTSLKTSQFWHDAKVHIPSYLHKQLEKEEIKEGQDYKSSQDKVIPYAKFPYNQF